MRLHEKAPAKVNLTLAVLGRRRDGYHILDSLVVFATIADELTFEPGPELSLDVAGPTAPDAGILADNLVLKAAHALARLRPGLTLGRFHLIKNLPVAAGLGGGSADAAAALRLLARANGLPLANAAVMQAALATGSDVPVCLEAKPRWMRGAGEILSRPIELPPLPAVLVNPRVATPTAEIFKALGLEAGCAAPYPETVGRAVEATHGAAELIELLSHGRNDLEPPSIALRPVIGEALAVVRAQEACRLARMSGSGATVFGLFETPQAARAAQDAIRAARPGWWVVETTL
ncbi:4-(cytidine 5'-diphospho)-2-C-methyl-D-erythritol kinase [Labrys monachus]|uniref:4-diphosphocytidyl-2-C-methyl-D-erythritol kinase n=1 Tax=Labrys monachus TaxID=217067 RepID=A0ABU0FLG4_9HYPH|nr:4-(cytidine 5'-diphospho)-2-C-methyl-D-erythritol kinase [Labrys monachus]MDQ0394964.1 4-diphosphocytidyl-2-C-methyl-D-erythritol kinase [Labrys monachus]